MYLALEMGPLSLGRRGSKKNVALITESSVYTAVPICTVELEHMYVIMVYGKVLATHRVCLQFTR